MSNDGCPKCGADGHTERYNEYEWLYCECGSSFCDGEQDVKGAKCLTAQLAAANRELDAAIEHHQRWMDTIDNALNQPRDLVDGSLLDNCVAEIKRLQLELEGWEATQ